MEFLFKKTEKSKKKKKIIKKYSIMKQAIIKHYRKRMKKKNFYIQS
jgi:hypothetical protein